MKKIISKLLITSAFLSVFTANNANAFCGFYVAKADTKIFNKASKVVITRNEDKNVITMASDYTGDVKEFAMIVPVPVSITKEQVHVTENKIVDHLDAFTSPRLVEYFDSDPCRKEERFIAFSAVGKMAQGGGNSASSLGITIEEEYTVGEYDIVILSAKESGGLIQWLNQNGYKVPHEAKDVVMSYIKQGIKFFVAKVNLAEYEKLGHKYLRPIQVAFESKKFMLPIRLGTVNADGAQELFIFTLTKDGRVEPTNYRTSRIPTDINVPLFVRKEFNNFYKAMFDEHVRKENMQTIMLEYAWDMGWCDPCASEPMSPEELRELGVFWVESLLNTGTSDSFASGGVGKRFIQPVNDVFVTRMHVRYDLEHFPDDIVFNETKDKANFQGRFIMNHPWNGESSCEEAKKYKDGLGVRFEEEAQNLAKLTGWKIEDIREKMKKDGQTTFKKPIKWYERIWPKN
ncbi:hypothetical protein I862_02170 [endosymbiont of Acanthamoeba sp. UWC8]|uniref:DUF2330 domain-containing protein n=1 Tax=endosymbiont of Acanthamoeba sp. UWC8 TaxID=86106 RepID=UPI0004D0E7E5|nr:DUF2330 domain-containing protein [endosymbiont of Acanthamoeba sp. UWC8]AIF80997.1 hypothetical protein I862_02170 [endosymbiont of Acanthamoeba sp. UWC8]